MLFVIVCRKEQLYLHTIYFDMISNDTVDKSNMYICVIFACSKLTLLSVENLN